MASCGLSIRIPHSVLLRIAHRRCMGATGSHPQHRRCVSTLRKRTELRKTTWCSSWREPPSCHWRRSLLRVTAVSPPSTTDITTLTLSGSQLLGVSGVELATPAVSAPTTTDVTTTAPLTTGSQILGVNGLVLPNATTSGAVPQAPTSAAVPGPLTVVVESQGEVIATSGGSSITGGATGRTMPECMAAWDKATHITKTRWKGICARTLTEF
jgi:hypothetical protein